LTPQSLKPDYEPAVTGANFKGIRKTNWPCLPPDLYLKKARKDSFSTSSE